MDYKEKYEQALERAKVINPGTADYEVAVKIFPELKESEDERIRKALIDGFTVMKESKNCGKTFSNHNIPVADILAWLEKQDPNRLEKEIELAYKTADEVQYRKGFEDGVASVKTAEWSEDDEKMCKNLLECLRYGWRKLPTDVSKYKSWLKSLRPHPKQEWSEEDENLLKLSLENLTELKNRFGEKYGKVGDCIQWLKSLKERMKGK